MERNSLNQLSNAEKENNSKNHLNLLEQNNQNLEKKGEKKDDITINEQEYPIKIIGSEKQEENTKKKKKAT
jgi:hypothetical protein